MFGLNDFYLGHFGRVPVFMRYDVLFLAFWVMTSESPIAHRVVYLLVILMSVLLHELGHAAVATVRGMHGVRVVITGMGGFCSYSGLPDPLRQFTISIAGPLMNFTLAGFAWIALRHVELPGELVFLAVSMALLVNLYLGIMNSLPIYPFDGGQALFSLLQLRLTKLRAASIVLVTSVITAILALAVVTWLQNGQIPWLIVVIMVLALLQAFRDLR